jgi:hypothetical protein
MIDIAMKEVKEQFETNFFGAADDKDSSSYYESTEIRHYSEY